MKVGKKLLSISAAYTGKSRAVRRECFIDDLVKHFNWSTGAEIGVREGRTSFHLLNNNTKLKIYAVDKDIAQFYNPTIREKYKERLVVLEGISWEVSDAVEDSSLDFVFIDAGHGYKSVMKDINAWRPKLKKTGWLIGHDINFPAVHQAVTESCKEFKVGPDNIWFLSPEGDYNMLEKL